MTLAPARIGIDVSKAWLDTFNATTGNAHRIANQRQEIEAFLQALPPGSTVVFEATAPYDAALRQALSRTQLVAIRANPGRVRDFARAAGRLAKTDQIDARTLAAVPPAVAAPVEIAFDPEREALVALHRRRDQLVDVRAIERGRSADVADACERGSLERHIAWLDGEIARIEAETQILIKRSGLASKAALLRSLRGVGDVTVTTLLALLPELGCRSAKAIAALAGLAPINNDSGTLRGQRHVAGGRRRVRKALYMAALAAIRCVPRFKACYRGIKARSGHAKVAVIAVARKLLVTLNAMIKNNEPFRA